jgi:signal transduction histidine kinase
VLFPANVTSPSEADLALLSSLADQTSIVLGTDLIRHSASQASAFTERERIARDLHDSVSQGLFSLHARAQVVRRGLRAGNLELALEAAEDLEQLARQATREMRELLTELHVESHPAEKDGTDEATSVELAGSLQRLAESVTRRDGLAAEVTVSPAALPALPDATAGHLLRIAGEAVHNVIKHARARQVLISVTADDSMLTMDVHDDGVGFAPGTASKGLGQRTMRQRAAICGGTFTVTSTPGTGTHVVASVPLSG